jgi:eukaryotic translation initiation factor 2C
MLALIGLIQQNLEKSASSNTFKKVSTDHLPSEEIFISFLLEYSIVLGYPNLPLVDVGGQKRDEILLPPEICIILPNQAYKGKLTDDHTKEVRIFRSLPIATYMLREVCR